MTNLRVLVNFDTDGASLEDLYLAKGVLGMIDQGFQGDQIETPEWVVDKMTLINAEITSRTRAELERRLRAAKARRNALKTREEKATALDQEISALESKLK